MKRAVNIFFLAAAFLAATLAEGADTAVAPVVTKELIEHAPDYDSREILFEGEAIGDPLRRGDDAWINLLDSNAAMGVFMPARYMGLVANYGSNRRRGDTLRVHGVFHRACPDHGGEMDIHAVSVEVVARGTMTSRPIDRTKLSLVPVFLLIAAFLWARWRKREAAVKSVRRFS